MHTYIWKKNTDSIFRVGAVESTYQTTACHNKDENNMNLHSSENLKYYRSIYLYVTHCFHCCRYCYYFQVIG
jgi:hypothetical protein